MVFFLGVLGMAYKKHYTKKSPEEKKKEITKLIENAENGVANVFHNRESLKEYLSFMSQFYNYSSRNMSLIQKQFDGAHAVASFKAWKDKGYSVKKGEKGIRILVPYKRPEGFYADDKTWKNLEDATEEEKRLIEEGEIKVIKEHVIFGIGTVFDISQTTMPPEDYPKFFPNKPFINGNFEHYESFMRALYDVAKKMNVTIVAPYHELGSARGVYSPLDNSISLNPRNSKLQNVATLIHELGHAKMHTIDKYSSTTEPEKEFQAEMVNYVVCHHFGIDNEQGEKEQQSLDYIHSWTKGKTIRDKAELLDEVKRTSEFLIQNIEEYFEKEKMKSNNFNLEDGDAILFSEKGPKSVSLKGGRISEYLDTSFVKCINLKKGIQLWTNDDKTYNNSLHEIVLPESLSNEKHELELNGNFLFTGTDDKNNIVPLSIEQIEEIQRISHTVKSSEKGHNEVKRQEMIFER